MATKTERLHLRIAASDKVLFDAAAAAEGRSVSEFLINHARDAAEHTLADRTLFRLDPQQWEKFEMLLDRPAQVIPGLRDFMAGPSVGTLG